jgi:hypothetical protein
MSIGTGAVSNLMLGAGEVSKAYLGADIAWQAEVPTQLGTAYDFSMLAGSTTTLAAGTSTNWKTGGPTIPTGVAIGSEQHYGNATATQANADVVTAYNHYKALPTSGSAYVIGSTTPVATIPVAFSGHRFEAGVFNIAGATTAAGEIQLDGQGDANAEFIFQLGAAFAPSGATFITLLNGARSRNVYFVATGAVAIGAGAQLKGTVFAGTTMGLATLTSHEGRLFSGSTMTLATGASITAS